jgi:hypothetical protein
MTVIKMYIHVNDNIMQVKKSGHAKFRFYQTQTVIAKNLDVQSVLVFLTCLYMKIFFI